MPSCCEYTAARGVSPCPCESHRRYRTLFAKDPDKWGPLMVRNAYERSRGRDGGPDGPGYDRWAGPIYHAFGRSPRIAVPDGCGVLAAADDRAFVGLQLLAASLLLSHDCPMAVVDLGLSEYALAWLRKSGVAVLGGVAPIMSRDVDHWQNWDKPEYLAASPFRRTLWLDVDILVNGDLAPLFAAVDAGPLLVGDHFVAGDVTANKPGFYRRYPVPDGSHLADFCSGVMGWDRGRAADDRWLQESRGLLRWAAADPDLRGEVSFWDQGLFLAAAEQVGLRIDRRPAWNRPGRPLADLPWRAVNARELLDRRPDGTLLHYQGSTKPWDRWDGIDVDLSRPGNLKVFLLGHDAAGLALTPPRPFLEPVDLTGLDPDQSAAESRFYDHLPPGWDATEYVGFGTWRWDEKWCKHGTLPVAELNRLANHLQPRRVFAGLPTGRTTIFPHHADYRDVLEHWHPGIGRYVDELREKSGRREVQASLWSQNFIAHRDVARDLLAFHAEWMAYYRRKYGPRCEGMAFPCPPPRTQAGWVGEWITCHYFASRGDLEIVQACPPATPPPATPTPPAGTAIAGITRRTTAEAIALIPLIPGGGRGQIDSCSHHLVVRSCCGPADRCDIPGRNRGGRLFRTDCLSCLHDNLPR